VLEGSELPPAVAKKNSILKDITTYSPLKASLYFGNIYHLYFHGGKLSQERKQGESDIKLD
jgi:hypothetical protein